MASYKDLINQTKSTTQFKSYKDLINQTKSTTQFKSYKDIVNETDSGRKNIITSDEVIKNSPVIQEFKKDLPKTKVTNRLLKRFTDSASFGITGQLDKRADKDTSYLDARSFKDDALGASLDWAATLAGYAVPGLGWAKAGKALLKAPKTFKIAKTIFAQDIEKGTKNRIVKIIKEQAKEGLVAGAAFSGAEIGVREKLNPDDYSAKDNLKTLAIGSLSGLVADPLVSGAFKGISKLANKIKKTPEAEELIKKADEIIGETKKINPEIKDDLIKGLNKTASEPEEILSSSPAPDFINLSAGEQKRRQNIERNEEIAKQSKDSGIEFDINSINIGKGKKQKITIGNIKEQIKNLETNILDINSPLKNLPSKDVYENKLDTVRANGLATQTNEKAFVDIEGNVLGDGDSYQSIINSVPKDRISEFEKYLIARQSVSKEEKGDVVFNEAFKIENNATPEGIIEGIKKFESDPNNKTLIEAAKKIDGFTKSFRELLVKEKVWTKEIIEKLEKDYPHYIPLLREFDEETNANVLKRAKEGGSIREIRSPIKTLEEQIPLYYRFILNNRTNVSLLNSIKNDESTYKQLGIEIIEKTEVGKTPNPNELEDVILQSENSLIKGTKRDKIVYAVEDGIKYKIKIDDPKIYEALALIPDKDKNIAIRMFENLTRFTKRAATGILAPRWAIKGLFMDSSIALLKSKDPIQHFGYLIGSMIGSLPKSEKFAPNLAKMAESFYLSGGGFNATLKSPTEFVSALDRSGIKKVGKFFLPIDETSIWGRFQQYFENINRIAAFNTELKRLGGEKTPENVRKSMEYSRKITTDYSIRGKWAIEAEKFSPYTTASIAGVTQNLKFAFNNPMKTIAGIGIGVLSPAIYEYVRFRDDPDYKKINKREKYRNIYYGKNEKGEFLKIPIDPQLGFIKQMFNNSLEAYQQKDPDTFKGAMEELSQIYLPPPVSGLIKPLTDKKGKFTDVLSSTSLSPIIAVFSNKGFSGIPIVPLEYELLQVEEKYKYNENTTLIAKKLGALSGLNPFKIDYIIRNYSGDLKLLMPLFSEKGLGIEGLKQGGTLRSDEFFKDFITNATFSNNLSEQFYTAKNSLIEAKNQEKLGVKLPKWYDERAYNYLTTQSKGSPSKFLSYMKELKRETSLNKNLSKKERERRLKEIKTEENAFFININAILEQKGIPLTTKR
jgi:hypothetical protein